jgi:hypothetical protein
MNEYYYLIASLPYLQFGQEAPVSKDDFIKECRKWLSPGDMRALLSADLRCYDIRPGDTAVLREWKTFDMEEREEIARVRAAKKKTEGVKVPERLKNIFDKETPLLSEMELERIRWRFLEDKSERHYFDLDALLLYFLKLQIQERLDRFDKDKGEKFFYETCEVSYEQAVR